MDYNSTGGRAVFDNPEFLRQVWCLRVDSQLETVDLPPSSLPLKTKQEDSNKVGVVTRAKANHTKGSNNSPVSTKSATRRPKRQWSSDDEQTKKKTPKKKGTRGVTQSLSSEPTHINTQGEGTKPDEISSTNANENTSNLVEQYADPSVNGKEFYLAVDLPTRGIPFRLARCTEPPPTTGPFRATLLTFETHTKGEYLDNYKWTPEIGDKSVATVEQANVVLRLSKTKEGPVLYGADLFKIIAMLIRRGCLDATTASALVEKTSDVWKNKVITSERGRDITYLDFLGETIRVQQRVDRSKVNKQHT
jgi:hypothetical protein